MKKMYFILVPIIGLLVVMFAGYFLERYLSVKSLQEFERTYGYEEILQDPHFGRTHECYPPEVYQSTPCYVLTYEISSKQGEEMIADLRQTKEAEEQELLDSSAQYLEFEIPIPRSEQSRYTIWRITFESLEENDPYTVRISKRFSS